MTTPDGSTTADSKRGKTRPQRNRPALLCAALSAAFIATLACGAPSTPPIAIQGAVDYELGPLLAALGEPQPVVIQGFSFWQGRIAGQPVVVSRTEVGMVHAAMATMILIEEFEPRLIINQGTAGAASPDLAVGDIVLGRASAQFGAFKTAHRDRGEGVGLEGWVRNPRKLRQGTERVEIEHFPSDPELLSTALSVPYPDADLVAGVVGSADQWNREIDKLLWAHEVWGVDSEDMESAAVAQVAHIYRIPFLPVRIISDSEYHDPEFRRELGTDCAQYVVSLVEALRS